MKSYKVYNIFYSFMPYKLLNHPSDLKVLIKGKNLAGVFASAALALAELQFAYNKSEKPRKIDLIEIKSENAEMLLVDFLSELLYLSDVNDLAYNDVEVEEITERKIKCKAKGFSIKEVKTEIKAVTYHDVEVKKTDNGFEAIALFDV